MNGGAALFWGLLGVAAGIVAAVAVLSPWMVAAWRGRPRRMSIREVLEEPARAPDTTEEEGE